MSFRRVCGDWHASWQNRFPVYKQEVPIRHHRRVADVELSRHYVLEIQHSWISPYEVRARKRDYANVGKQIIWLVDGTSQNPYTNIRVVQRQTSSVLLFQDQKWPLKSFGDGMYQIIYVHYGTYIYQVQLSDVLFGCVPVTRQFAETDFCDLLLRRPDSLLELGPPVSKPALDGRVCLFQGSPGNGKTYSAVQRAIVGHGQYAHYSTFVFLTKCKSALSVIQGMFHQQNQHHALVDMEFCALPGESPGMHICISRKQTGVTVEILILTLDSLMCGLSRRGNVSSSPETGTELLDDPFLKRARFVSEHGATFKWNHTTRLKGVSVSFSPETLLVLDEATHAKQVYFDAIVQLMLQTGCDADIIGDILQSTLGSTNCMTSAWCTLGTDHHGLVRIETVQEHQIRRFGPDLVQFLVQVMGTEFYTSHKVHVPIPHPDGPSEGDVTVTTMPDTNIYDETEEYEKTMFDTVGDVVQQLGDAVRELCLLPRDILCLFPIINRNPFACLVETAVHTFWCRTISASWYRELLCNQQDTVRRAEAEAFFASLPTDMTEQDWALIHRSEGQSINVHESEQIVRMVSFHSSQGDGRRMVFVFQLSRSMLKMHDRGIVSDELKMLSLLNVALSRSKRRMRVYVLRSKKDGVDKFVGSRFGPFLTPEQLGGDPSEQDLYAPEFQGGLSVTEALATDKYTRLHHAVQNQYQLFLHDQREDLTRPLVDFGHHIVRSCVSKFFLFVLSAERACSGLFQKHETCTPFAAILYKVRNKRIITVETRKRFISLLGTPNRRERNIPVLKITNFERVHTQIVSDMRLVQQTLNRWCHKTHSILSVVEQLEPNQMILMWYMVQLNEEGHWADTDIRVIYQVYIASMARPGEKELQEHYDRTLRHLTLMWKQIESGIQTKTTMIYPGRSRYLFNGVRKCKTPDFNFVEKSDIVLFDETTDHRIGLCVLPTLDETRMLAIIDQLFKATFIHRKHRRVDYWFICATTHAKFQITIPNDTETRSECLAAIVRMFRMQYEKDIRNRVIQFIDSAPKPFKQFEKSRLFERTVNYVVQTMERLHEYCEDNGVSKPPESVIRKQLDRAFDRAVGFFESSLNMVNLSHEQDHRDDLDAMGRVNTE